MSGIKERVISIKLQYAKADKKTRQRVGKYMLSNEKRKFYK